MIRAIGHRGAPLDRIENTLPAFHEAVRQGAASIELDVRRTRSGELIVFHDDDFERLAGVRRDVAGLTLKEVRGLVLRDPALPGQAGSVPTLDEVFSDPVLSPLLTDRGRPFDLILELKADDLEPGVVEAARARGLTGRVMVCSFRRRRLERIRSLAPDLRTSLLFSAQRDRNLRAALDLGLTAVNPEPYDADADFVDRARSAGLLVTVGQTCDPETIRSLLDLDVWGIHSDRPSLVVEAQRETPPQQEY